jgi:hypothetical protein
MSEYQYYEFQAIDRPLTQDEMDQLRAISTRATISPTSFVNEYNYGNFKGDPLALMKDYFDAFVYVTNWGTRQLMLRLPRGLVDPETVSRYSVDECLEIHPSEDHVVLDFTSNDEEGGGWEEGEGWLPALVPLRDDIARGDLRALYLGWLLAAETGYADDEDVEPPVPPGLGRLSPALKTFVEFLRVSDDMVAVAAERSADKQVEGPASSDLKRWIQDLPDADKNALLLRLAEGNELHARADLLRRFRESTASAGRLQPDFSAGTRTASDLFGAAEEREETRRREEAERKAKEQARRAREEAAARATYLDDLATREESAWRQVETLIDTKRPTEYDHAIQLIRDLCDVGLRNKTSQAFEARLSQLRARHAKKVSLLSRLERAGLARG